MHMLFKINKSVVKINNLHLNFRSNKFKLKDKSLDLTDNQIAFLKVLTGVYGDKIGTRVSYDNLINQMDRPSIRSVADLHRVKYSTKEKLKLDIIQSENGCYYIERKKSRINWKFFVVALIFASIGIIVGVILGYWANYEDSRTFVMPQQAYHHELLLQEKS